MKRKCKNCNESSITILQSIVVGFGITITCRNCSSRLRLNEWAQTGISFLLIFLTLGLLVSLTNSFGVAGFVIAFLVPLGIDLILSMCLPLRVIK